MCIDFRREREIERDEESVAWWLTTYWWKRKRVVGGVFKRKSKTWLTKKRGVVES